ncbi:MAG: DUF488 domain-containing protein [Chitinophagaceae bacterium]
MSIKIKRIYEPFASPDGYRILVDRLWPRGIKKEDAHIDVWMKEVAPSTELRKWFNHDPEKWNQFTSKYKVELKNAPAFEELRAEVAKHKTLTLVYAASDELHNNAAVLQQVLKK